MPDTTCTMAFKVYTSILLLTSLQVTVSLHYYEAPALDNQFSKFEITSSIPSDGKGGTKPKQAAMKLAFRNYNRRYITFNFKGKGNAQLQFFTSDKSKKLTVIIGGGTHYNKVYFYSNKSKLYTATVNGITSEQEYRSFWIRAKWRDRTQTYSVYVGLCSDPRENKVLDTGRIRTGLKPKLNDIRLSTAFSNSGQWQFASAGQKLGACGDGIGCSDRTAPNCDQEDKDWGSDRTGLIGTCIPESSDFSSVVFGNGKCRKACGTGNEVCGAGETCKNDSCLASTTLSTTTAGTTTASKKTKAITHMTTSTPSTTTAILTTCLSTSITPPTVNTNTFQTSTTITSTVAATTTIVQTTTTNRNTTITTTFPYAPTKALTATKTLHTSIIATTNPYSTSAGANRSATLPTTNKATTFLTFITPATTLKANYNMTKTTTQTTASTRPTTVTTTIASTKTTDCFTAALNAAIHTLSTAQSPTKVTITNPPCHTVYTITTTMPTTTATASTVSTPTLATTTHALTSTETTTATESTSSTTTNSHKSTISTRTSTYPTSSTTTMSVTTTPGPATTTESTPTKAKYATAIGQATTASTSTPTTITTVAAFPTTSLLYPAMANEENSSFSLGFNWAIIAGAGCGLATVVAITLVLWKRATCFRHYLCLSRRVTPAKSNKPDSDDVNNASPFK